MASVILGSKPMTPGLKSKPGTSESRLGTAGSRRENSPGGWKLRPESPRQRQQPNAWYEVLELCKKGFAQKMETLTKEIVHDVRQELFGAVSTLRDEVKDIMTARESPLAVTVRALTEKVTLLEHTLSTSGVDLAPVVALIGNNKQELESSVAELRNSISGMSQVSNQIHMTGIDASHMLERVEIQLTRLEQKAESSESKLEEVCEVQESLRTAASSIAKDLQCVLELESRHHSHLEIILTSQVADPMEEVKKQVQNMDVGSLQQNIDSHRRQINSDMRTVLAEIARIQQAMQLDFVQVVTQQVSKAMEDKPGTSTSMRQTSKLTDDSKEDLTQDDAKDDAKDFKHMAARGYTHATLTMLARSRVREFCSQTDPIADNHVWTQTDANMFVERKDEKKKKVDRKKTTLDDVGKSGMGNAEKLAQKAKEASMKPPYDVFDFYKTSGCVQAIAKSTWFENGTLCVVFTNALWMAFETDNNKAPLLHQADPFFQVVENSFCAYFFVELCIRFAAFERKFNCLQDFWFVFDTILAALYVTETWIVTIIILSLNVNVGLDASTTSVFRLVRLIKLLKLSRLAKILRMFPEIVTISKGIGFASRSVLIFFVFWVVIVYVFAILCRALTDEVDVGKIYFSSVYASMNTLLLQGLFPESLKMLNEFTADLWYLWPIMVSYLLLVSITVMYMLVGVLVQVVGVVSNVEREALTVSYVANEVRDELEKKGYNLDVPISKYEFMNIMVEPAICKILNDVNVDIVILSDMLNIIFEDVERKGKAGMPFQSLVETILEMRGSNPSTVKDCKENIKIFKSIMMDLQTNLTKRMVKEFEELRTDINEIREDIKDEAEAQRNQQAMRPPDDD
eukprot:TRINITY_DN16973_c0_g1_i2.p1 TRINITY_DN16973_c0_g1~~TRINITY_DN16973_c0_g1_i2.p1  ORF type:complete len:866 (+),score=188.98 TRINITY_DN16973_c0_g1_i2:36-2600(+)